MENTLIVVLADNGRPFSRAKTRVHDGGMKTALIAPWPAGIKGAGVVSSGLVSSIDLALTILELAGAAVPASIQGRSLRAMFADPGVRVRHSRAPSILA